MKTMTTVTKMCYWKALTVTNTIHMWTEFRKLHKDDSILHRYSEDREVNLIVPSLFDSILSYQNYQEGSDEEHKSVTRQSLFKTKRKSFSSEFRKESAQLEKQKQKEEQNDEDEAAGEERDYYFDDDDESDIAE